jgi:hypothetical protein
MNGAPEEALMPLRDRLDDWTEYDIACFYLGKLLGMISITDSYGDVKSIFFADRRDSRGVRLLDMLIFMAEHGILESRDNNFEFRWHAK